MIRKGVAMGTRTWNKDRATKNAVAVIGAGQIGQAIARHVVVGKFVLLADMLASHLLRIVEA
jgi:3-hydroxyacyl-CoA dehydrogenase